MTLGDTTETGAIGVDAATADEYRTHGLFSKIVEDALRTERRLGIPLTLFFPAPTSSLPSSAAAPHLVLDLFVLPLRSSWLAANLHVPTPVGGLLRTALFRVPAGGSAREVGAPPVDLDELWDAVASNVRYGTIKNGAWWRWRYAAKPHNNYRYFETREAGRLVGAAVTTTVERRGRIAYVLELLTSDAVAARALVTAVAHAHSDVDAIGFRAAHGSLSARMARAAGLRPVPKRIEPNAPDVAVFEHSDNYSGLAAAPWCVTTGDMDYL
jgi:hypothetical protein